MTFPAKTFAINAVAACREAKAASVTEVEGLGLRPTRRDGATKRDRRTARLLCQLLIGGQEACQVHGSDTHGFQSNQKSNCLRETADCEIFHVEISAGKTGQEIRSNWRPRAKTPRKRGSQRLASSRNFPRPNVTEAFLPDHLHFQRRLHAIDVKSIRYDSVF